MGNVADHMRDRATPLQLTALGHGQPEHECTEVAGLAS